MSPPTRIAAALALAALAGCASTPPRAGADGPGDLRLRGNRSIRAERLRAVIAEEVGSLAEREYRRSAIDDAAFAVEQLYARRGWPFCRVEYELLGPGAPRAELAVEEGPRTELKRLSLSGNESFPSEQLLAFIKLPVEDGRRYFHQRGLDGGLQAISAWYFSQGFLDVETAEPEVSFNAERTRAEVALEIREGQRYFLRRIEIDGAPQGSEPDIDHLIDAVYTPPLIAAVRRLVRESMGHHGYPDAQVGVREERGDDGAVVLRVDVLPGPLVTITGVRIAGNNRTRRGVIESALALGEGDVYDIELERRSFRKLYETGLFDRVRLGLEGEGQERSLVVEVEEAPSTELYVEPGWGSYELARLGIGWRESNLLGTGRILEVEGTLSRFARRAEIGLTDPRFLGSEVSASLSTFYDWREEPSFTDEELGTGLTFTRQLTQHTQGSIGYQFRRTNLIAVQVIGPVAAQALADVDVSSITATLAHDTRDQVFAPRTGSITRPSVELATSGLGSEIDFVRTNLRHSRFFALGQGTVLGLSYRGGVIVPIGSTSTIPLQERYFNGGENSVRSFREDELGPLDPGGKPVGGEAYTVLSAELRQQLSGALEGALFFDTGNLQPNHGSFLSFDDMRHAVGVGLRYMLPIGPLRLDAGFNPDPRQGEDDYAIHFSVGMAF